MFIRLDTNYFDSAASIVGSTPRAAEVVGCDDSRQWYRTATETTSGRGCYGNKQRYRSCDGNWQRCRNCSGTVAVFGALDHHRSPISLPVAVVVQYRCHFQRLYHCLPGDATELQLAAGSSHNQAKLLPVAALYMSVTVEAHTAASCRRKPHISAFCKAATGSNSDRCRLAPLLVAVASLYRCHCCRSPVPLPGTILKQCSLPLQPVPLLFAVAASTAISCLRILCTATSCSFLPSQPEMLLVASRIVLLHPLSIAPADAGHSLILPLALLSRAAGGHYC